MAQSFADTGQIQGFHAHIYYDPRTRAAAEALRAAIGRQFTVELGRWHDEPVGPHPVSMYQVAFPHEIFAAFVPWLMLNRDGLTILLHPETGNAYRDHAEHGVWFGAVLPLRLEVLRRS